METYSDEYFVITRESCEKYVKIPEHVYKFMIDKTHIGDRKINTHGKNCISIDNRNNIKLPGVYMESMKVENLSESKTKLIFIKLSRELKNYEHITPEGIYSRIDNIIDTVFFGLFVSIFSSAILLFLPDTSFMKLVTYIFIVFNLMIYYVIIANISGLNRLWINVISRDFDKK